MIALVSTIFGFMASIFPEFFKLYQDKRDKQHELEMFRMQVAAQQQGHVEKLAEIEAVAITAEMQSLNDRIKPIGIKWVDALNGTVRPVLAYAFFLLYAGVKVSAIYNGLYWQIWTQEDIAIFSAIIGFYFGGRMMSKAAGRA